AADAAVPGWRRRPRRRSLVLPARRAVRAAGVVEEDVVVRRDQVDAEEPAWVNGWRARDQRDRQVGRELAGQPRGRGGDRVGVAPLDRVLPFGAHRVVPLVLGPPHAFVAGTVTGD